MKLFYMFIMMVPILLAKDIDALNTIQMGDDIQKYQSELYLLTGDEPFYDRNPGLKKIIQQKLAHGLKEGMYNGKSLNVLNEYAAGRMNLFFYQDKLYKVTWSFRYASDMRKLANDMAEFLTNQFGLPHEETDLVILKMATWTDGKNLIRTVRDGEDELSVEFSDIATTKTAQEITGRFE